VRGKNRESSNKGKKHIWFQQAPSQNREKTFIGFVMSVCPSVRPYGINVLPTDRFFVKFYIGVFFENLPRKFKFI